MRPTTRPAGAYLIHTPRANATLYAGGVYMAGLALLAKIPGIYEPRAAGLSTCSDLVVLVCVANKTPTSEQKRENYEQWAKSRRLTHVFIAIFCLTSTAICGQAYDVMWTFGNVDFSSHWLDEFSPASVQLGTAGSENPTLTLESSTLSSKVVNYGSHPLGIISKGLSASRDKVLLSMGPASGTFESSPAVK